MRGLVVVAALFMACSTSAPKADAPSAGSELPPAFVPGAPAPAPAGLGTGKVLETMSTAGYTYVRVDVGGRELWAAGPETAVKVGDTVTLAAGSAMSNYQSKTLNRSFETVYFVSAITVAGSAAAAAPAAPPAAGQPSAAPSAGIAATGPAANPHASNAAPVADVDLKGIRKADGGYTVAELFGQRDAVAGRDVAVRGKVVKAMNGIMGKNWLHVRDGTGGEGSNDLTVTTAASAQVGAMVLVKGKAVTNKDFGFGYKYELIVEDAQIAIE